MDDEKVLFPWDLFFYSIYGYRTTMSLWCLRPVSKGNTRTNSTLVQTLMDRAYDNYKVVSSLRIRRYWQPGPVPPMHHPIEPLGWTSCLTSRLESLDSSGKSCFLLWNEHPFSDALVACKVGKQWGNQYSCSVVSFIWTLSSRLTSSVVYNITLIESFFEQSKVVWVLWTSLK